MLSGQQSYNPAVRNLKIGRTVQIAIVLYPGMTTLDAIGPYEVLRFIPESELRFVSHEPGPVITDSGILVLGATHSYDETPSPDIVLVPGSEANTTTAMADGRLLRWLNRVHQTSRYTLSVCSGALILAAAGLLKGRPATTHWIAQERLPLFGADPQRSKRIVQSGRIITAAGVSAGIDLALLVVGEICGRERAEIVQLLIEYDPQPPFQSGHPSKASKSVFESARTEMLQRAKNRRNVLSVPVVLWRNALDKVRGRFGFSRKSG
jgi:transcriptional regulator GlxA family with amidase domain